MSKRDFGTAHLLVGYTEWYSDRGLSKDRAHELLSIYVAGDAMIRAEQISEPSEMTLSHAKILAPIVRANHGSATKAAEVYAKGVEIGAERNGRIPLTAADLATAKSAIIKSKTRDKADPTVASANALTKRLEKLTADLGDDEKYSDALLSYIAGSVWSDLESILSTRKDQSGTARSERLAKVEAARIERERLQVEQDNAAALTAAKGDHEQDEDEDEDGEQVIDPAA